VRTHELKCWPVYFAAIDNGSKTFEYRKDDRGYAVGDQLTIREWDAGCGEYTGRVAKKSVTYIMRGGTFPLPDDMVILALGPAYSGVRGGPREQAE